MYIALAADVHIIHAEADFVLVLQIITANNNKNLTIKVTAGNSNDANARMSLFSTANQIKYVSKSSQK